MYLNGIGMLINGSEFRWEKFSLFKKFEIINLAIKLLMIEVNCIYWLWDWFNVIINISINKFKDKFC